MSDTQYLKKRHDTWFVRVPVPPPLRGRAYQGTKVPPEFVRTLKTPSLAVANKIKHSYVAEFKARIEDIRRALGDSTAIVFNDAVASLRAERAKQTRWVQQVGPEALDAADEAVEAVYSEAVEALGERKAEEAMEVALGQGTLLGELYPCWLAQLEATDSKTEHTRAGYKRDLAAFNAWALKHHYATVETVTHKVARAYVAYLMAQPGRNGKQVARDTVKKTLSSLAKCWQWLRANGHCEFDLNPWQKHEYTNELPVNVNGQRVQFTDDEVVALLSFDASGLQARTQRKVECLKDMVAIELFCGLRTSALADLRKDQIELKADGYWVTDVSSKDHRWAFPLARALDKIIARRLQAEGSLLFPEFNGSGNTVSHAFNGDVSEPGLMQRVGIRNDDGYQRTFYSLRRTFNEACEAAGIAEKTTDLISGRGRDGLAYGLYSKGQRVDLRGAIEKVTYADAVSSLISQR